MNLPNVHFSPELIALLGKGFLNLARSLQPPLESSSSFTKFLYDFIQNLASNKDLAGKRRLVTVVRKDVDEVTVIAGAD